MRAFKKVWAEFANPKTELLERAQLVPFLGVSFSFEFFCLSTLPNVVIDIDRRVRNWAAFSKFASTPQSSVSGTLWLLVGIRRIPT